MPTSFPWNTLLLAWTFLYPYKRQETFLYLQNLSYCKITQRINFAYSKETESCFVFIVEEKY